MQGAAAAEVAVASGHPEELRQILDLGRCSPARLPGLPSAASRVSLGVAQHADERRRPADDRNPRPAAGECSIGDVAVALATLKPLAAYMPKGNTVDQRSE
jgi:hypothetical protein